MANTQIANAGEEIAKACGITTTNSGLKRKD
jgi:hypothetical protein